MINKSSFWVILALLSAPLAHAQVEPLADSRFTVGDIRVEGLERVSEGTVFNYLPVNIGDELTPQRVREAIRALYETKFFKEVELRREGSTLIVDVRERPVDRQLRDPGQQDIKTES